jgi:hypothetical protein
MATQKILSEPYPMKAKGYGFFSETPIAQANNLKVTIGVTGSETPIVLIAPIFQKRKI